MSEEKPMTVDDVINELSKCDRSLPVHLISPEGRMWSNRILRVEQRIIQWEGYSVSIFGTDWRIIPNQTEPKLITVGDVIKKLQEFDPSLPIFAWDCEFDELRQDIEIDKVEAGVAIKAGCLTSFEEMKEFQRGIRIGKEITNYLKPSLLEKFNLENNPEYKAQRDEAIKTLLKRLKK